MSDAFYLAWRYLAYHRWKSLLLVLSVALIVAVPLAMERLLAASEERLAARAEATPLVVGAKGSALDLMMSTLYFTDDAPEPISIAGSDAIWDSGLSSAIPLYVRFKAEGAPIVGATLDYFDFRGLEIAEGRGLAVLGEAVLGARVAERLGLRPGDALISSPENLFDIAGVYPLKMSVVGVLRPTGGPDDRAVFVDLKTAWVIEGVGHGHEDVIEEGAVANVEAAASLVRYAEITPENIDSFHFHGDPSAYPITAVIAVPNDARSGAILQGRYLDPESAEQIARPSVVMAGLVETVFSVKRLIDVVLAVFAVAAAIAIALVVYLSLQLRASEIATISKLGCRRGMIARLMAAEIGIVLALAIALAGVALAAAAPFADEATRALLSSI